MIKTVQDEMREANERLHALVALAETEDREFTADEQKESADLIAKMKALDSKRKRGESFADLLASVNGLKPPAASPAPNGGRVIPATGGPNPFAVVAPKSLGAQFVESDIFASLRATPRSGSWMTPPIELEATFTVNPGGTQLVPGGVTLAPPMLYPPEWGVADLFAPGTVDGGMVQYLQETGWVNNAAPVAPGAAKPESNKTFLFVQAGLIKIAHFIPVPDEFLDDVAGMRSFIDAQMIGGVAEKLNDQLLNGSGSGGNMQGLISLTGRAPDIAAAAGGAAAAIAAQRAQVYALGRLRPDAVVMNPMTWAGVAAETSTAGGYLAGPNVFAAGAPPTVWGLRVVESPEVPDGTAVVGAFRQGGQLFRKGGIVTQASNSHADYFQKNITAIRAEVRVALAIYRPTAFGNVTGLPVGGAALRAAAAR